MSRAWSAVLDHAARAFARAVVRTFFRERHVEGAERLEAAAEGPLLVVANHVNNLVDPLLLLASLPRAPRFLAKSTLWSHPVVGPLVRGLRSIPVYRAQDREDVSRNALTFDRCCAALRSGSAIALFPEGRSHNEPRALPLKTGAARIALAAAAPGLRILPIGLNYERKFKFRSRVLVRVGSPIDLAPDAADDPGRASAVRALTARMASDLHELARGFAETAPAPPTRLRPARPEWWLLLPLALLGAALNWLPYRIPGWISESYTRTADEPATYKILAALIAFPTIWTLEAATIALRFGPIAGLAAGALAPLSGYLALVFFRRGERA
ncbi:MAG TPA: 1-acyl-sn-glycerol-3-phosphate acyltransferase [Vicinamibacteria bacterium]|nr:1-acyl-sn-glycerol-3-phosphate acyltransferase [Vicinamibacteria bacterium]